MIYFLAVLMSLSLFWTPVSFAGYKDIDTKIAEQEIYSHIMKEDAMFTFRLQKGGFEKGVAQGMWDTDGNLTAKAVSSKLKSLKRTGTGDFLISSQNADIKIKITEIKEMNLGMKFKQAKFTWQYHSEVPSFWKRFMVAGGHGYAAFALGNDGWRYDGMELGYSEEPFPLTGTEIDEERKEMQQIGAAKGKEEETKRRLQLERQKRIEESKKAGKSYGTFALSTRGGQESCKVSDAGVTCQKDGNNEKQSYSIMFVDIRDIRKTSYPGPDSKQYYAIEVTMREIKRAYEEGTGRQDSMNTSWRNVAQWISESRDDLDRFLDVLTQFHREWRAKFSDIAE
ncbi:MAG: hypothetical protein QME44_10880 [Thermodesulfobacteriota bacterium]|nr:hypothetical protein [Thermodesulfobacteriota bacterium]